MSMDGTLEHTGYNNFECKLNEVHYLSRPIIAEWLWSDCGGRAPRLGQRAAERKIPK